MKQFAGITAERLDQLIAGFSQARIAVVGDFFLDKYLDVDPQLAEVSLETGKTAHQVIRIRHSPGAAGTVVCNLAALGAGCIFCVGIIGDDGEGYELRRDLATLGCELTHLHSAEDRFTPTYLKPRDANDPTLAGEHSRYDTKNRQVLPSSWEAKVLQSLKQLLEGGVDAVIIADQVEEANCGVITDKVRGCLADWSSAYPNTIFWADSRRRIREFRRVITKPNYAEAMGEPPPEKPLSPQWEKVERAILDLRARTQAPVCLTCGPWGTVVTDTEVVWIPGLEVEGPIDPTGAGDSATAGAVLALSSGGSLREAALVGNLVASVTIQQLATTGTASPEQLRERLPRWLKQHRQ